LSNIPFDDTSVTGRTLRYLKAMKVSLHDAPSRTRLEMEAFGAKHLLAAPMVVGERHFGALVALRLSDSSFSEYDLRLMESCCAQVSLLVEHVKLFDDLTQSYANLEKAQAEVVRHARLAALGELSAVMAHEVRNPLGVIFNSLASLKRRTSNDAESKMLLDMVSEEADRLNRIVGDLLDFAKPYEADRGWVDLRPLVDSAAEAGRSGAPESVTVHSEVPEGSPKVLLDGHLLRQALINLIVNAIQAMPNGGNVWVRASTLERA
jgi:signal transduction histidine kinase